MEYLISAGIVFLILFYNYFVAFFKSIQLSNVSNKKAFRAIVIISFVLIIIGERIPYILIGTLIYVILQDNEDSSTLKPENI
jgi:prolipoprotein diacylglyceryltransferase